MRNFFTLILCLGLLSCSREAPTSQNKAVADREKTLGMMQFETEINGEPVQSYQFVLCDRQRLDTAEPEEVDTLLADQKVCYNPFVDSDGDAAVYMAIPQIEKSPLKSAGKLAAKFFTVAGGVVLAFYSVKFAKRYLWDTFIAMEEYQRFRRKIEKMNAPKRNRLVAWLFFGGMSASLARYLIVGDGAFTTLERMWQAGKIYFNNGKALFGLGKLEEEYIENQPFLTNNDWHNTKKVSSTYELMLGIKKTLSCEFSPRYKKESPLLSPIDTPVSTQQ